MDQNAKREGFPGVQFITFKVFFELVWTCGKSNFIEWTHRTFSFLRLAFIQPHRLKFHPLVHQNWNNFNQRSIKKRKSCSTKNANLSNFHWKIHQREIYFIFTRVAFIMNWIFLLQLKNNAMGKKFQLISLKRKTNRNVIALVLFIVQHIWEKLFINIKKRET